MKTNNPTDTHFELCYFPPSALRRYLRNGGTDAAKAVREGSTASFCRSEPNYATREAAQTRADERNAREFRGQIYLHVVERETLSAPVGRPITAEDHERAIRENHWGDRYNGLSEANANDSDAFERRVLGLS